MEEKQIQWENLSPEEKKKQLFLKQKELLDTFLKRNAISQAQYAYSIDEVFIDATPYLDNHRMNANATKPSVVTKHKQFDK